jgi:enamine deaminase RidA (YjgF/YER057c/UK114 family)
MPCGSRPICISLAEPPASTFFFVSRLMRPGWLIEIEAVAAVDG